MRKTARLITALFVVSLVYMFGFYAGQSSAPQRFVTGVQNTETRVADADFNVFWEAWRTLEEKYVGRSELDRQKMVYGAVEGMVRSIGDPYTAFFEPEQSTMLEEDISGEFSGIGAEIGFKGGALTVIAPLKDSPAQRAGLRTGDKILKVDSLVTDDLSLEEAVRRIRGERGTSVTLSIYRDGFSEPRDLTITRDIIKVSSLEWEMKEGGIAHLKLYNFVGGIDADFQREARMMLAAHTKKMIIDLRGNPGGFLDSAVSIASYFIPRGDVVAVEDFGNGDGKNEFRSKGYPYFQNIPLVVLVDGGSASASEILAGALKDARGATIIGERTFGKGSVQEVVHLSSGTLVKITVAKWLTPSGRSIQDQGIGPDIEVLMTPGDREAGRDPQLEKALEALRAL